MSSGKVIEDLDTWDIIRHEKNVAAKKKDVNKLSKSPSKEEKFMSNKFNNLLEEVSDTDEESVIQKKELVRNSLKGKQKISDIKRWVHKSFTKLRWSDKVEA